MRPFAVNPRGPIRRRPPRARWLIALPRQCPQWELSALHVLMKPKAITKAAAKLRNSTQRIPRDAEPGVRAACEILAAKLSLALSPEFPPAGDFAMVLATPGDRWGESLAIAKELSKKLPGCWLTVGRAFLRDGVFFNRERRFGLRLVESSHHRVPREVAMKLR